MTDSTCSFEMKPVPEGTAHGWALKVDGKCTAWHHVELAHPSYGTLTAGQRPEGYPSWVFREVHGGGAVTLVSAITDDGELLIGLVQEKRANMTGGELQLVLCIVGGFVDPDEDHDQAQAREGSEEVGLDTVKAQALPGLPINPNRAFFVADINKGEGVVPYALQLPMEMLEFDAQAGHWEIKEKGLLPSVKKEADLVFLPWYEAVTKTADAFALAAIARLLATLRGQHVAC